MTEDKFESGIEKLVKEYQAKKYPTRHGLYERMLELLKEERAFKAEKPTAPVSLVEFPCPTCGAERFKTERRLNGDSWCRYGHKHPTKDFVRPVPSDKPAKDLQGQHAQMVALAKAHGLDIAADWAVKMSGKTFSEEKPTPSSDEQGLREAVKIMEYARNHGGPVAYQDEEDSVGYYVCCGNVSYKDHEDYCWYRKMCEFLDNVPLHPDAPSQEPLAVLADRRGFNVECDRATYNEWRLILFQYIGGKEISSHIADTYAEAEAKARQYLNSLPDKGATK